MDYANIFRRSWNIIWKNKFMLVLGFLAALGGGVGSGGGGSNSNFSFDGSDFANGSFDPAVGAEMVERFQQIWPAIAASAMALLCIAIVVGIVLWLLRLTAEAGLIDAASRLDAGEKLTFGDAIGAGWHKLGRMIGLNIVLFGVVFLLGAGLAILGALVFGASMATAVDGGDPSLMFGSFGLIILCVCGLVCLLIPLMILLNVLYQFSQRAAVIEDNGVFASIRRGWDVIKTNLGQVIILLLILLMLGLLVAAVVFAIYIPLTALTAAPIMIRLMGGDVPQLVDFVTICGGLLLMIVIGAIIQAVYVSFRSTVITLAYEEFINKKALPE